MPRPSSVNACVPTKLLTFFSAYIAHMPLNNTIQYSCYMYIIEIEFKCIILFKNGKGFTKGNLPIYVCSPVEHRHNAESGIAIKIILWYG